MNLFKIETGVRDQGTGIRGQELIVNRHSTIVNCKAGFTLIEMMVVLVIMSILITMAYSTFRTPNEQIACKEVFSQLQLTKMRAVSKGANESLDIENEVLTGLDNLVGVSWGNNAEVFYQDSSVTPPPAWPIYPTSGQNGVDMGAGGTTATFTLKGMALTEGSVYLKDVNSTTRICAVYVSITGLVRMKTSSDGGASWN